MKILRAFQIIKRDGEYQVSTTYNEVDEQGDIVKVNEKDSFMAVNPEVKAKLQEIEQYILENRLS